MAGLQRYQARTHDTTTTSVDGVANAAEDPLSRDGRNTFYFSRLKRPPVGVMWKLREEGASSGVLLVT
ncbi:hypothetical protein TNCV_4459791 [Trichonephila clavipes]|nr:hypothetical protein TNCV_4459791 [Trichonephila clavipes]